MTLWVFHLRGGITFLLAWLIFNRSLCMTILICSVVAEYHVTLFLEECEYWKELMEVS